MILGKNGASHLYSPQKGAKNLLDINILEDGLKNLSKIIKQKYKVDVTKICGGGAAGGCGAGLFGILVPVSLKKMNIDPAIASSVFVTTITDVIGFVSFLGVGAYFL